MPTPTPYALVGYELALGAALLCVTLLVHGVGMVLVRKVHARLARSRPEVPLAHRMVFSLVILMMLLVHGSEIAIWSLALFWNGAIDDLRHATYYVSVTYTTLGYEEALLPARWRAVAPLIAMAGLFAFGWTTSTLFALVTERVSAPGRPA